MYCPQCGTPNNDGAVFCLSCGQRMVAEASDPVPSATPVSAPVQSAQTEPVAVPTVKAVRKPLISKQLSISILFYFLLAALSFGLLFLLLKLFGMQETIGVYSLYDKDIHGYLTLKEFCELLIKGNSAFNPTVVSTAFAVGTNIAVYGVPTLAAAAFIASAVGGKKMASLNILTLLFTVLSSALIALVVPLSVLLVPDIKVGLAEKLVMLSGDVGDIVFTKLIIFSIVATVLAVVALVISIIANKRRSAR